MIPIKFEQQNKTLTAPDGMDNVLELPVFTDDAECVSCWALDDNDMREVQENGGKIWLRVLAGGAQPPVTLQANTPFLSGGVLTAEIPEVVDNAIQGKVKADSWAMSTKITIAHVTAEEWPYVIRGVLDNSKYTEKEIEVYIDYYKNFVVQINNGGLIIFIRP